MRVQATWLAVLLGCGTPAAVETDEEGFDPFTSPAGTGDADADSDADSDTGAASRFATSSAQWRISIRPSKCSTSALHPSTQSPSFQYSTPSKSRNSAV